MAVVLALQLLSVDPDVAAPTRTITCDVDGTTIMLTGSASDVAALTIPGAASLTMSQP